MLRITKHINPDIPDTELLNDYRSSGDLEILGELYQRYMHLVYGVCLKYFQNREESKDAVIQIFEELIGKAAEHEIENFKSWLYVLTKNFCLMQIRAQKARDKKFENWKDDEKEFMESSSEMHLIDKDGAGEEKELSECIEKLKEEQRLCIRLFYFDNKCYQEIADKLNLEEKKVKSHLQNGKRNLKICLEEKNVKG